jgi:uncharacterized protein DUF1566
MNRAIITIMLSVAALTLLPSVAGVTQAAPPNPAPPCFDNANRYVDCGNGTVTDSVTGLVWLRDAACLGRADWAGANAMAATLKHGDCGLSDHSRAGDWRLPTQAEWAATLARAAFLNCRLAASYPSLTNNDGSACLISSPPGSGPTDHAFVNVPSGPVCDALNDQACTFWTSTTSEAFGTLAVRTRLFFGTVNDAVTKPTSYGIWPVRTP